MGGCADPISLAEIVEYWAAELDAQDQERLENHVFECETCAAALAEGEMLADGVSRLVRRGLFHALVSDRVLNRLARDGVRIRTYTLEPGEVVPCAVRDDDDLVVTRLRGGFSDAEVVFVVATLATGQELSRSDVVVLKRGQHELIDAIAAERLRQLPATTVHLRVTTVSGSEQQILAEYTLEHAGPHAGG